MGARVSKLTSPYKFARTHAWLWRLKIAKNAIYCTLCRQCYMKIRHKKTDLPLFEKERKIYQRLMNLTTSKVVKDNMDSFQI